MIQNLFALRHDYPHPLQAARARIVLPLSLGAGWLLLAVNVLVILNVVEPRRDQETYTLVFLPLAWIACFAAAYLVQTGRLRAAMGIIGAVIAAYAISDVLLSGSMTTGVIFPMLVIYASVTFGPRGAIAGYGYAIAALLIMVLVRSEGRWGTDPIDNIETIAIFSGVNLSVIFVMLWLFAGHLQQILFQVNRAVAQTRATAAIGQTLSRILNIDELLTSAVDLIRDRFALYHVQIFILDEAGNYANLAASTGMAGRELLAQGYRVTLDARTLVGEAISARDARSIGDLSQTAYQSPEALTDARAELVIPLVSGEDDVIGALDLRSARPNAFGDEDIETMRIMANQLGQAIRNARLFEAQQHGLLQNRRLFLESETALSEIERLNRQLTGQSWREYMLERDEAQFNAQMVGDDLQRGAAEWTADMRQAASRKRIVTRKEGNTQVVAVPVNIRGQPVGAVEVRLSGQQNPSEALSLIQAVVERMAFSLENARLFEQAQLAVEREQQINQIAARLQGLTSVEDALATAVDALGQALGAERGAVRLVTGDMAAHGGDSHAALSAGEPHAPPVRKESKIRQTVRTKRPTIKGDRDSSP
jgi:GAF domain-containing protein